MPTIRYVCGADIAFKGDEKVVVQPMAICETPEEAAEKNKELHSSFGYAIYEVDMDVRSTVTLCFGIRQGRKDTGIKILRYMGQSYDILSKAA